MLDSLVIAVTAALAHTHCRVSPCLSGVLSAVVNELDGLKKVQADDSVHAEPVGRNAR